MLKWTPLPIAHGTPSPIREILYKLLDNHVNMPDLGLIREITRPSTTEEEGISQNQCYAEEYCHS